MLIRSSRIPKQHMHKKENMLLLVIPSQSHFYTHTKYEIETSEHKQAPPQKNQQEWWRRGSKTRQKQLKTIEPHTLTNLCKLQCLDQDATRRGGWLFFSTSGRVHFHWLPVICLHLFTSGSTFLKGKSHSDLPLVEWSIRLEGRVSPQEESSSGPLPETWTSSFTKTG